MGTNGRTLGQVGCVLTAAAMALNSYSITIDGALTTPKNLNQFVRSYDAYLPGTSSLIYGVLEKVDPRVKFLGFEDRLSYDEVVSNLHEGITMIGSVHDGAHFVLAYAGADDGINIMVEDSGYPNKHYAIDQIDGWVKLQIAAEQRSDLQTDYTRKSAIDRAYEDQSVYPESYYAEPKEYGEHSTPALTG